eukprot:CAMPEP_0204247946 /NCGR_PEP_ID=MMETSP0361-20130328/98907_1 /ASSEMBLY_ACC=CAM_ASM_000343 /TAXON_ID=268821 /ORGANISM="Scrippsiella Hangoei, Strain SHTV-5" /LENGTH=907 /DNA_ID=CAMNT_0051221195 /DNA_START=127 /DNA_END=2853 /DNA_ORIENTATION=-
MQLLRAVLASTIGASFQFGFSTGFVNNTETFIRQYFIATGAETTGDDRHFNVMWSLAVSGFAIGGFLGTLAFPALASRVGRKWAILSTTGFCYASCYMIAFPAGWWALILGRVLVGIGAGGACATVPMYVSEIAPLETRGTLGTVHQLMITIGIVTAQALSTSKLHLLGDDRLWHGILLVPCACTTILLLLLPGCEDSPVYLLQNKGAARAAKALWWFRGKSTAEDKIWAEIFAMRLELSHCGSETAGFREIARDRRLWGPVLVGVGVNLSMQLSGIDAMLYYSTRVLEDAGVPLEWAQVYTVLISSMNVLVTIPAMLLMDRAGRKVLQICGLGGMCLAYTVMTMSLLRGHHLVAVGAMFVLVVCYAFGPGCIAWFIVAELTPVHVRPFATTVGLGEIARDRRLWGPVLVGVGVNLSMQLSGIDAVLYYSTRVLEDAGVPLEWAQVYTVLISSMNVLVTIPAMLLMDRTGRKVLQICGLGGMCLAYTVMTLSLLRGHHLVAVGAMFVLVVCYAFGPGCIAWFIVAELTPVHVRPFATTVGLGANWLANFAVAFTFPHILAYMHSWTFSIFAVLTLLLTIFTVMCLPETHGRTAAEIAEYYAPVPSPGDAPAAAVEPCTPMKMPRPASMASLASTVDTPRGHGAERDASILGKSWSPIPSNKSSGGLAAPLLNKVAEYSTPPSENQPRMAMPWRCSSSRTLARLGMNHLAFPDLATVQIQKSTGDASPGSSSRSSHRSMCAHSPPPWAWVELAGELRRGLHFPAHPRVNALLDVQHLRSVDSAPYDLHRDVPAGDPRKEAAEIAEYYAPVPVPSLGDAAAAVEPCTPMKMPRPASMASMASTVDTPGGHGAGCQVRATGTERGAWILGKSWSPIHSSKSSGGLAAPLLNNVAEYSTPPSENQSPMAMP